MKKLVILALVVLAASCAGNHSGEEGFQLYYPSVTEICPGTVISISPTWVGGNPANFTISGVRGEEGTVEAPCFSVNAQSGVFSISGSDIMPLGHYEVDITCSVEDQSQTFNGIIGITFMKAVPDGIHACPSSLEIKVSDIVEGKEGLPTAIIAPAGDGFVKVKRYLIKNVYRDGALVNKYKTWFSLDEQTGEFGVVTGNPDFLPGTYTFDLKLTTYKVGAMSEEGIYKNAITVNAVSVAYSLEYPRAQRKQEVGSTLVSEAPFCPGVPEGTVYAIKSVTPENGPAVSIDPVTGVLSVQAPDAGMVGNTYAVYVTVTNEFGTGHFSNAFTFRVVNQIHPVTQFSYGNISGLVSGRAIDHHPTVCDGDDVVYAFEELPSALQSLSIDSETGTISSPKGVELEPGSYTVKVKASNEKGAAIATFTLEIIANPNAFTFVRWGNNMGLEPIEKYGNQFRVNPGSGKETFPVLEHDIPAGRPVSYTLVNLSGHGAFSTTIHPTNGTLSVYLQSESAAASMSRGVAPGRIVVTVGDDEDAVTRVFPLFIGRNGYYKNGYKIEYTPFAIRINPITGGTGPVPVIENKSGEPAVQPTLDFRINHTWYNLNGPSEHKEGRINGTQGMSTFLGTVWNQYYSAIGETPTAKSNPMSWWYNYSNGRISLTGAYIDGENGLRLVVNPERFVDDYGYGDGIVDAICRFALNGLDPNSDTSGYCEAVPLLIWLDPTYEE